MTPPRRDEGEGTAHTAARVLRLRWSEHQFKTQ